MTSRTNLSIEAQGGAALSRGEIIELLILVNRELEEIANARRYHGATYRQESARLLTGVKGKLIVADEILKNIQHKGICEVCGRWAIRCKASSHAYCPDHAIEEAGRLGVEVRSRTAIYVRDCHVGNIITVPMGGLAITSPIIVDAIPDAARPFVEWHMATENYGDRACEVALHGASS